MESLAKFLGAIDRLPAETEQRQIESQTPSRAAKLSIKERARVILESPEYFQSVLDRIKLGTLPAAIELRYYDEAYGKLADRIDIHTVADIDEMDADQCEQEALRLLELARQIKDVNAPGHATNVH